MSTGEIVRRLALAAIVLAAGATAGAEDHMAGDEIRKTFAGAVLEGIYFDGSFFTEEYRSDGSILYHDANNADTGDWSVRQDSFCTFYKGRDGACFFVRKRGNNCFSFYEQKLGADGTPVPREEWTSQGWLRSEPSTCTIAKDETI